MKTTVCRRILGLVFAVAAVLTPRLTCGQNSASGKFNDAIKRSQSGAEAVARLAELSDQGISRKLIDAAEAIGVFPCRKKDALIEYAVICPGAISRHLPNGWTAPAYYKFGGGGFGRPMPALGESNTIILLFLDQQSVDCLSKPFKFEDEKE